jgi:hypothetical protein
MWPNRGKLPMRLEKVSRKTLTAAVVLPTINQRDLYARGLPKLLEAPRLTKALVLEQGLPQRRFLSGSNRV